MKWKEWLMFSLLGLIWGSSFLWIKIALREVGPFVLVGWRLLFGAFGMMLVVAWRRPSFPRTKDAWLQLAVLGTFNTAIPFLLISWGEQRIDSAMASILNGSVPLFAAIFAHIFLADDRLNLQKAAGLVMGFVGVVFLMSRELGPQAFHGGLWGQVAVLGAALSYGGSAVFARKHLSSVHAIVQAFVPMVVAGGSVWILASYVENPLQLPASGLTWLSLLWLGLLGSCAAYLLYFSLLHAVGPTRTTLVTYIFPIVGLGLGVIILGERFDLRIAFGASLVMAGIVVVNWRQKR
jgi:drug/metabolite transporter (DMT)-like permease